MLAIEERVLDRIIVGAADLLGVSTGLIDLTIVVLLNASLLIGGTLFVKWGRRKRMKDKSNGDNVVVGANIQDSAKHGINLGGEGGNVIVASKISNSGGNGVNVTSPGNIAMGLVITGSKGSGISFGEKEE